MEAIGRLWATNRAPPLLPLTAARRPPARRPLQLFCMESADDTSGPFAHQLLQLAKLHARPCTIYVSAKAEPALVEALRAPLAGGGSASAAAPTSAAPEQQPPAAAEFDVRCERSSLFAPRQARAVLEAVHLRGTPPGLSARERLHRLNARLSLSSEQQVCAAGALLAVLAREGALGGGGGSGEGGDDEGGSAGTAGAAMSINGICEVSLAGYLMVDPASLAALQVGCWAGVGAACGAGRSAPEWASDPLGGMCWRHKVGREYSY